MSTLSRPSHRRTDTRGNASVTATPRVRSSSPTSTSTPTVTSANTKLNVVTRVAIEGVSHPSPRETGAEIRMYLKIALPLESVFPGMSIPLFPEDSVRITMSQVHPLDQSSAPYHFSPEHHPLLYKAAKALSLPQPSAVQYRSVFGSTMETVLSSRISSSSLSQSDDVSPVDPIHAGHVLVSGYQVCYILPKEFPPLEDSRNHSIRNRTPYKNRRSSLGEKHVIQFMAVIQMYIPYITSPPQHPYLLSIPTPRCLQNFIKFRIVSNKPVSTSLASLSSVEEEDWAFSSEPAVIRKAPRSTRTDALNNDFADDESSDSSVTDKMVSSSQGTFQSTDRIRIRWAKRSKATISDQDGWSRVGVGKARGEMRCSVLGLGRDPARQDSRQGILMRIEYTGTCTGLWFPGVATLVGMDVSLVAKESDVTWAEGYDQHWNVSGGRGFAGSNIGKTTTRHHHSAESARNSSSTDVSPTASISRRSSVSSLLRAPLPTQRMPDYSFEGSTALTPSTTLSSIGSLTPSTGSALYTDYEKAPMPPGSSFIIHLNMNDCDPPIITDFSFSITGVCLLTPRHPYPPKDPHDPSSSNAEIDSGTVPDPVIVLPNFTVLTAHSETTSTVVENSLELDGFKLCVYHPLGDISRDAQALKTVLQKGNSATCAADGGRISVRSVTRPIPNVSANARGSRRAGLNGLKAPQSELNGSMSLTPPTLKVSQRGRDGPLLIPSVMATVTPLQLDPTNTLDAYAVRVTLPVPVDPGNEYLEFGLAQLGINSSHSTDTTQPLPIEIAGVSIDGIPVRCEVTVPKQEKVSETPPETLDGQLWWSWVIVHTPDSYGGTLIVDYLVKEPHNPANLAKSRWKPNNTVSTEVFLPVFVHPVGRLEVVVDHLPGFRITTLESNLVHKQDMDDGSQRLLHFSTHSTDRPRLSIQMIPVSRTSPLGISLLSSVLRILGVLFILGLSLVTVNGIDGLKNEIQRVHLSLDTYSVALNPAWCSTQEPMTVTTTVYATSVTTVVATSPWRMVELSSSEPPSVSPTPPVDRETSTSVLASAPPTQTMPIPLVEEDTLGDADLDGGETSLSTSLSLAYHNIVNWPLSLTNVDSDVAIEKVLKTVDVIWQVLRKIYHYPLDPP